MVSRASRGLVVGVALALTLRSSPAYAQLETFVQAVRDLTEATVKAEPTRSNDVRNAVNRMAAALAAWDRNISGLEARVARDIQGAPDQRAYELHVQLGVTYRARGRRADALREFDAAATLKPSASDLQQLRALTLEAAGRPEEAGQAFLAAWNLDVRNPVKAYHVAGRPGAASAADRDRARQLLTDTYRRLDAAAARPAAAPFVLLGVITDNLSRTPIVADHAAAEGFALLAAENYSSGVAALERADRASPVNTEDSPVAHFARAQRAEVENRVADARREYQAALAGALAGRSTLLVAIARLEQVEGHLDSAIAALTQAVRLNPNDPDTRRELADAYFAQGRTDDAFCELMAAVLIDPRDAQVHAAIGQVYLDTGRNEEAVTAFNRALALKPERYETRYALATAFTRLGRSTDAAREFDLFEHARRQKLDDRRRDIAREVEQGERRHGR
jgi:tetratricopeptide (TPR) repeat protein